MTLLKRGFLPTCAAVYCVALYGTTVASWVFTLNMLRDPNLTILILL
jgi:hypothetical protein